MQYGNSVKLLPEKRSIYVIWNPGWREYGLNTTVLAEDQTHVVA